VTTFRLVPRKHGRVSHLDVKVDDATATIRGYTWNYEDGGSISFEQRLIAIDGNWVVAAQKGKVELPTYKADVSTTFSNYKLNVPVADSTFNQQQP